MTLEGSHWYRQDGSPFYEVKGKNGLTRAVTLRDARKERAVPSVTTVLKIIAKPKLARWKEDQGILAALTLPRHEGESSESLLRRIREDADAQVKEAADEGTRIHDAIEKAWRHEYFPPQYKPHVEEVMLCISVLFPTVHDWLPERSFCHASGYGGKVDLHSPSTGIVIDYKGKDGDFSDGKRIAYDQHIQLAPYQDGLGLPRERCANIFVSRTHPGKVAHHVWSVEEVEYASEYFKRALALWQHHNKYQP